MANRIQFMRRVGGALAVPAANLGAEGAIALGMPGPAGTGTEIALFAHDGVGWRKLTGGMKASNTAPPGPANGDTWVDTSTTPPTMRVFDGTNWLPVGGLPSPSATAPANPVQGQIWADITGGAGNILLKAWNGNAWVTVNATVTTQTLALGTAGADVGAAYVAAGSPAITGTIVIGTWGTPAAAYMLTNRGAPAVAASWTSLGGSTSFATQAEVDAGTLTTSVVSPSTLRGTSLSAPSTAVAAAADANKLVRLNAGGTIDSRFITLTALTFRGAVDIAAAYVAPNPAWGAGDFALLTADATAHASWNAVGVTGAHKTGDVIIWDGTRYWLVPQTTSVAAYLPLSGTATGRLMDAAAQVVFDVPAGAAPAAPVTRLNGSDPAKSAIDGFTIDCGTF